MKKKVISIRAFVIIVFVVGYVTSISQNNVKLSALALANVEAFADGGEYPDMEIVCNQSKHTSPGSCWSIKGECFRLSLRWDDCTFTGVTYHHCTTACP